MALKDLEQKKLEKLLGEPVYMDTSLFGEPDNFFYFSSKAVNKVATGLEIYTGHPSKEEWVVCIFLKLKSQKIYSRPTHFVIGNIFEGLNVDWREELIENNINCTIINEIKKQFINSAVFDLLNEKGSEPFLSIIRI